MQNHSKKNFYISLIVGVLGFLLIPVVIFLQVILQTDIAGSGFALIMLGLMVAIISPMFGLLFYYPRSRMFDQLMYGKDSIARWHYSAEEWQRFARNEANFRESGDQTLLLGISILTLIICIIFAIAQPEAAILYIFIFLGLTILLSIVVWLKSRTYSNWEKLTNAECLIGKHGLILQNQVHSWNSFGSRLENIGLTEDPMKLLLIKYSCSGRNGRQEYTIRVPIPGGKEKDVNEIVKLISAG